MSKIYFDTMMFIYWIEERPEYAPRVTEIINRMEERGDQLYTSTFALGEVLVGFYKSRATAAAARVQEVIGPPFVTLLPFTTKTAIRYGQIRAHVSVSPADGIHLACAAEAAVDLFLTHDARLMGKTIPGIQFIASMNTDLL